MLLEFELKKAIDNQKKDFDLPEQKLDIELMLEILERYFHKKSCDTEECKKIIKIFMQCRRFDKAAELKSDLKTGY